MRDKLADTTLYLLRACSPVRPGVTSLLKLIFLVDYEHYRRHLRTVTDKQYLAFRRGPVIDDYNNIFQDFVERKILSRKNVRIHGLDEPKIEYGPLEEPDEDIFTETELEVLDYIADRYGRSSGAVLTRETHLEGPWRAVWDPQNPGRSIPRTLFRWIDNIPSDRDIDAAKRSIKKRDIECRIRQLDAAAQ